MTTGRGLGGVDPVRAAARIGEGAVLTGAVMLDLVSADELVADRDLDRVTDHGHLHLATLVRPPDAIVRPRERHPTGGVDLAVTDTADAVGRAGTCFGARFSPAASASTR